MRATFIILLLTFAVTSAMHARQPVNPAVNYGGITVIPKPALQSPQPHIFNLTAQAVLVQTKQFRNEQIFLLNYLRDQYAFNMDVVSETPEKLLCIVFKHDPQLKDHEAYQLKITPQQIEISADGSAGIFYGVQTLIQLLPPAGAQAMPIACITINDHPRYKWRGMHLDCARHFFPAAFIKKYIDYLAMYKMNTFHWHLTDDQGWRIEIKKYPRLTSVGALRKGSMIGHYREQKFDSIPYGGFYTQEEIKDIVAYAVNRHVTIVPEIEMPGHAVAALAAYPQFSCSDKPVEVGMQWGVEKNVFCPTEETFRFLQDVLAEVITLFPGKYIHIGGDEVPKDEWNSSEYCKKLMAKEKLKDAHALQAYFIRRIEKFVNSKGRQIIGWDEILEGGLAPNAAVMSWRGTEGGMVAARQKHHVVMSPGSHCYFDHYQGNPDNEPVAIGGYTPVEKVYAYEPAPPELTADEASYIMGAQGNVWTEYINTPADVEYMAIPRMAALAEVLWSPVDTRDYSDFSRRLLTHFKLLDKMKVNYSRAVYEVKAKVEPGMANLNQPNSVKITLSTAGVPSLIRYAFDDEEPAWNKNAYLEPVYVSENFVLKYAYFDGGVQRSKTASTKFTFHKAVAKPVQLKYPPSEAFMADGGFTLVNAVKGNPSRFDNNWLGFSRTDLEAVIDFQKAENFSQVNIGYLHLPDSWIYAPEYITLSVSDDGVNFTDLKTTAKGEIAANANSVLLRLPAQQHRYLKVMAKNIAVIPPGQPGEGQEANMFIDEIMVE